MDHRSDDRPRSLCTRQHMNVSSRARIAPFRPVILSERGTSLRNKRKQAGRRQGSRNEVRTRVEALRLTPAHTWECPRSNQLGNRTIRGRRIIKQTSPTARGCPKTRRHASACSWRIFRTAYPAPARARRDSPPSTGIRLGSLGGAGACVPTPFDGLGSKLELDSDVDRPSDGSAQLGRFVPDGFFCWTVPGISDVRSVTCACAEGAAKRIAHPKAKREQNLRKGRRGAVMSRTRCVMKACCGSVGSLLLHLGTSSLKERRQKVKNPARKDFGAVGFSSYPNYGKDAARPSHSLAWTHRTEGLLHLSQTYALDCGLSLLSPPL